ncbi:MAG: tryptophan synthase subunit alpha, partial [Planctomycetota bacterium]
KELLPALAEAGADILEVGIPHTDPVADGPVIQAACERSLAAGTTPRGVLAMLKEGRGHIGAPIVVMSCVNPILKMGMEQGAVNLADAGADGVILSDVSLEESAPWRKAFRQAGVAWIPLAAPTTPPERAVAIARSATGFVYAISARGITGVRNALPDDLESRVRQLKEASDRSVLVGFGISTPTQVRSVCAAADGAVVGSAIVKKIQEAVETSGSRAEAVRSVAAFVRALAAGKDAGAPAPQERLFGG